MRRIKNFQTLVMYFLLAFVALALVAATRSCAVKLVDFRDGNPPWAKPVEKRQITGPSLKEVIRAMGESDPEDVIDNPRY